MSHSRATSSSTAEHKMREQKPQQQQDKTDYYIKIDLSDFTCPITKEMFYRPIMTTPCAHLI